MDYRGPDPSQINTYHRFSPNKDLILKETEVSHHTTKTSSSKVSISKYPAAHDKLFISAQKYNIVHSLDLESYPMWPSSRNNVNHLKHTEFSVQ